MRATKQKEINEPAEISEIRTLRPIAFAKTRIRKIGNSRGVILANELIRAAGLHDGADVIIKAADGMIFIAQLPASKINTDLSTWDKQFKAAIKTGKKPEEDFFGGLANDFDKKEW